MFFPVMAEWNSFMRMAGVFALALLFLSATFSSKATGKGTFELAQVMSAPFASGLTASPDGNKVAWIENAQGLRNVWVAAAPDWRASAITHFQSDDGQEISDLAWAPDGSYLLFARGGDFENGGENPNPAASPKKPEQGIWRADLRGTDARQITLGREPEVSPKGDLVAFIRDHQIYMMRPDGSDVTPVVEQKGVADSLTWSPDGARIAFVSDRGDHSFIGLYEVSAKTLRYLDPSVDSDGGPVWSPDGKQLAHIRMAASSRPHFFSENRTGEPWSIRVVDVQSGASRQIFRAQEGTGSVFHELASPAQLFWGAGDRIVFPYEQTGWLHLYSVPAGGGTATPLTPGDGEVEHVALSHDRKAVYFSSNIGDIDRRHVWRVPVAGGSQPDRVTKGDGIEWEPAPVGEGQTAAFLASTYNERAHAEIEINGRARQALHPDAVPAEFPKKLLVRPEAVTITAADGMPIHGQLFLPPDDRAGTRHPALIFFHGGSRRQMLLGFHYMYYYSNAYSMNQFLANHGYVVLSVNYRSGIGYGLDFREAIHYGAHGASEFNDVIGAGLFLKARADVDPQRIGVWGGSYGGYLTAMALARASDLFAAGVDFHGVHDWSAFGNFRTEERSSGDPELIAERQEAARVEFQSSPMASVSTWRSPVLLIHGDDDRNVNFSQSVMLAEALRRQHVEFEQLIFPNEIHDFLLHRSWLAGYSATADFFGRKLAESSGSH
jgi:dipeptidyl aminopeptidase/acylaminoacyl peptidase